MTNISLISGNNVTALSGATSNAAIGSANMQLNATEANIQTTWRNAGVFSNLYCLVFSNLASGTSTVKYRVGSVNGNQAISVSATSTGEFSDSTHTDIVATGNQINYQLIGGGTGNFFVFITGMQFAPTNISNALNKFGASGSIADTSVGTTYYQPIIGALALNTTEAVAQTKIKMAATLQNLYAYVSANTASVATIKSRIGGSNGNLSISIGSGSTGAMEDTTHTDSLVSGNLINTAVNSTQTTTFTITNIAVDFLTNNATTHYIAGDTTAGNTLNTATNTVYYVPSGDMNAGGNESQHTCKTGLPFVASNLEVYINTNGITATSVISFRINSADGNQSVSFGSGVTGYAEDTTHTDAVSATAEICYKSLAGATGTSISPSIIAILATYPLTFTPNVWYCNYDARVSPPSPMAQYSAFSFVEPLLEETAFFPVSYDARVRHWPKMAQHSYFVEPEPMLPPYFFPSYDARVFPAAQRRLFTTANSIIELFQSFVFSDVSGGDSIYIDKTGDSNTYSDEIGGSNAYLDQGLNSAGITPSIN